MTSIQLIAKQIDRSILKLMEIGFADDQQLCFRRNLDGNLAEISFRGAEHVSVAMKNLAYVEIYDRLADSRAFNVKLMDGALIQMTYLFDGPALQRHRLAFMPSPHLEEFQNNPDVYLEDELYADIVAKKIVPFPLRFDFDCREGVCEELEHPKSHLTLGQYENCRIPVSSPLTPCVFLQFVLRNFYHTAHRKYAEKMPMFPHRFEETLFESEKRVIHIRVPRRIA